MNVKPDEMAIVTRGRGLAGRIVEVKYACPKGVQFRLPNGVNHDVSQHDWVVLFQNPISVSYRQPWGEIISIETTWATAPDSALRPIGGLPLEEETYEDLNEPA